MFAVGRYWGRKPPEIIMKYVLSYTKKGDVILDPFAGAGGIIAGVLRYFRRAIYNDLNPIAKIFARGNIIKKRVSIPLTKKHADLYMVNYNGQKHEVRYYIWENNKIVGAKLYGGQEIKLEGKDYEGEIPYWYPKVRFVYQNGNKFERVNIKTLEELYTRRNLLILSEIFSQIPKDDDKALLAFFATAHETGKNVVIQKDGTVKSLGVPRFCVVKRFAEKNPYHIFEFNVDRVKEAGMYVKEGSLNDVLSGIADVTFLVNDAKKLPLDDESVDAIITDPPFFDEFQYFEWSYLFASWLNMKLDFDNEIVVNYNRHKTEWRYLADLEKAIAEMYRVLKKNKYLVLMFHEEDKLKMEKIKNIVKKYFVIEKEGLEKMEQRNVGARDEERGRDLKVFIAKKN